MHIHHPASDGAAPRLIPLVLEVQALAFAAVGVSAFAGLGVGSTALRIGVGLLFLALGADRGRDRLGGAAEGSPASISAVVGFEGFLVGLVLLWFVPLFAIGARRSWCSAEAPLWPSAAGRARAPSPGRGLLPPRVGDSPSAHRSVPKSARGAGRTANGPASGGTTSRSSSCARTGSSSTAAAAMSA